MWTFGSWQFRNWNATLILIWVAELLRRSRPVEGTSDGDGGMPLQLDFLLQLLTRNNCREPPQSVLPRFQPQNVSLTSVFLPSVFYASFCCRFLAFPFPLIFNFVWLLSFLVERFVHFSSDVYIEWPNARPYFRQDSTQKKNPYPFWHIWRRLGKLCFAPGIIPYQPEILAHTSRNYER